MQALWVYMHVTFVFARSNLRPLQRGWLRCRFREPTQEEVDALTMEGCRGLLEKYMRPDNIEVPLSLPMLKTAESISV